ncbi:LOW QUALITY PROTEIN: cubilin homolog [Colias croceus]|uniref:LOW QUALITY PROTEIN: cubilin homolog n=1 Tax=Colias crocea TaxID=72248 RepID=UPI001E27D73C|nr:LOW QUALITY PROTEIN: cubilin homolog [Colias croceus]
MTNLVIYFTILLLYSVHINCEAYQDRPKIKTTDGDLILESAYDKNIYIKPNGPRSSIFIGNTNILDLNITNKNGLSPSIAASDYNNDRNSNKDVTSEILRRIERLESVSLTVPNTVLVNFTHLNRRINTLANRVRTLQSTVNSIRRSDECQSHPCENGGTCLNLASGYYCLCPKNWKGENCDEDVNECKMYEGTDLGCQNGATCINRPGSYECICKSGWYGIHCMRKERNCSGNDFEMCGHGTCLQVNTGVGIKCMCDQGWTTNETSISCLTDVNECDSKQGPRCSINPPVECINLPGSFVCGHCPPGYEGDGFICRDIDECLTQPNGGCSLSPKVSCYNTLGSRVCGSCPPGYQGDGVICTWRGSCNINRGGCHPSAFCIDGPGFGVQAVQCVCPRGMSGDGIGIHGCYIVPTNNNTGCEANPCGLHGQCHPLHVGYTCICSPGYSGANCDRQGDYCASNPCLNGGTCRPDGRATRGYRCECLAQFTGDTCEFRSEPCGGVLDAEEGSIIYPLTNTTYRHNTRCAWVIHTSPDKVINVTFSKFNLEHNAECHYDFVQIHDGRSSASQLIGRFCGSDFPKGGNIISSHNNLYFWFRSDQTIAGEGFALHWTSIKPQCGGYVNATIHGHISSPGSPGKYPPNRDCYWRLVTKLGKRIQLHFFELDLESHANCSFDYLAIYDGLHEKDALINKFCNSSQPAPLQSIGSEMLIHFHSDAYGSGKGFQITYAPIEGVPGCGGFFTLERGEIFPPLYENKYQDNLLCDYKIQTRGDTKIRITLKSFNLERSFRCTYDYLAIYDGPSSDSRLVGKFCGTTVPKTFTSTSNSLFIQFKSDQSVSSQGFKISYESICHKIITGDSGTLKSPGYPFGYPKNTDCEYVIETSPGKVIRLSFQDFDIEDNVYFNCQYDYVEIRDGPIINSTLLGKYCGGSRRIPPTKTSTYNYLYIGFHSDASVSGSGFFANYTSLYTACGGIFRNTSGLINYPDTDSSQGNDERFYSNDQSCSWLLIAPEGMIIKITWNRFDIEKQSLCEFDYVELVEIEADNKNDTLGKYCGATAPPALTTSTNQLLIKFVSDNSIKGSGFSMSYAFLDGSSQCGGLYVKTHGYIYSPGWPNSYPANRDCTWTISVPEGQQISLNITDFDLEIPIREKCDLGDYLEIRDGGNQNAPLVGKYCGNFKSKVIISTSHKMHLRFHSDFYISGRGFKIEWDGTIRGCGGLLTGVTGSIASPNYPEDYYDNAECFYKIVTSSGSRIRITFLDLDLETTPQCRQDYVEIFDGRDVYSPSLGKFCTMTVNLTDVDTSSNYAFIKFRSDISLGGKGFLLHYKTMCHTNISGSFGVIESPGFPSNYPMNIDCLWSITVGKGNKINITFSHFNIKSIQRSIYYDGTGRRYPMYGRLPYFRRVGYSNPCEFDYLQFKQANEDHFSQKYCGTILPSPIQSKSNSIDIKFVSGLYNSDRGFRLEWVKDGCGTIIRKQFGVFTLANNLRYLGTEIECEWTIVTPPGTNVYLRLTDVLLEETKNCTVDAIEIYNGPNVASPLLAKVCNRDIHTFQAAGSNIMLMKFIKKSTLKDVYFAGNFQSITSGCGGRLKTQSGQIHSKNYPKNYEDDMDCLWYISVPKNHRIELNILDLDLYTGNDNDEEDCSDNIKIYEGSDILHSNYSYLICPTSNVSQIISNSPNIIVQFITDNYGTAKGFKANFSATCGAVLEAQNDGIITNDKFISYHNHNCTWVIKSPKFDQKIKLTLEHIALPRDMDIVTNKECPSSFLKIFDGDDVNAPLIGEYCGRKVPPMIVSRGSALTVVHGTYSDTLSGYFSAHYSSLSTACGGTLSSEEGSIASPNYPLSYPHAMDCEWVINTSPGNSMYLNFEKFDLAYSDRCNEDYLEIRENDGAGTLLGVYCGDEIPTNITKGARIYLKFHSDNKEAGNGFLLHYGISHYNEITGLDDGEISSPLYPYAYEEIGEFSWRIIASGSRSITIRIDEIIIKKQRESCDSKLIIYDGYDEDANVIEVMCGFLKNEVKVLQSSSSIVFIKFVITERHMSPTFHLKWSQADDYNENRLKKNCGYNQTQIVTNAHSVSFHSPNYPEEYGNNMLCEWVFEAKPSYHLILTFDQFELEETSDCYADYISIYTRNDNEAWIPLKQKVCIKEDLSKAMETSKFLKVIFESDSTTARKGFTATVRTLCGGILNSESGVIELAWEDRGGMFEMNKRCNWTIKVRPGRIIKLSFEHFNITNENECTRYVMVRNGESMESPLLGVGKYCGYPHETLDALISTSNAVHVSYFSNNRVLSTRKFMTFKLRYEELNIECGLTSSLDNGHKWEVINSPNYPSIPMPFSECVWIFTAPPGEILRVDFIERFDVDGKGECKFESIEIRDGTSEFSPSKGLFCGEKPGTIKTDSNALYIKYTTRLAEPRNGFKANISIDICGGTIVAEAGELVSPGYPHMLMLPSGTFCQWHIISPTRHVIKIDLKDFNLPSSEESCHTNLTIEEIIPANKTSVVLKQLCSDEIGYGVIETLSNEAVVKLYIGKPGPWNQVSEYRGFKLTFNSTRPTCGGVIKQSEGFITTPGYPRETNLRYCQWIIIVPNEARRVRFEIMDHNDNDRIGVYNDVSFESPINVVENRTNSIIYESTGNTLGVYLLVKTYLKQNRPHRMKAKFSSNEPALCGGSLEDNSGEISAPDIQSSYVCKWTYNIKTDNYLNSSAYNTIFLSVDSSTINSNCRYGFSRLIIYAPIANEGRNLMFSLCGNNTQRFYSIPLTTMTLKAIQLAQKPLTFNIKWKLQPCGGVVYAAQETKNMTLPTSYNGTLDCGWVIVAPSGTKTETTIEGQFNLDCSDEFIKISQGLTESQSILNYCKTNMPQNSFISTYKYTYIQYHSKGAISNIKLITKTVSDKCGGYLTKYDRVFTSPHYPKNYQENEECVWDISAEIGYRVSLTFINRFVVEDTANCTKDVVIIYDWKNETYSEIARLCGRTIPPVYNSSLNRMKVIFRSDANVNLDGFSAQWSPICGGTFEAKEKEQVLYSPGYTDEYRPSLDCTYKIVSTHHKFIVLKFLDFDLEGTYPDCRYDNVTISAHSDYNYLMQTYCGRNMPPRLESYDEINIHFQTDRNGQRKGFKFIYSLYTCGGKITEPTTIRSSLSETYYELMNCTWTIEAPTDKVVVVKFLYIDVESDENCLNDYISVFDGPKIDTDKQLALLCGHINSSTVIQSKNRNAVVQFISNAYLSYKGFQAQIIFSYSEAVGCGGSVNLLPNSQYTLKSPLIGRAVVYENYLDCHWSVRAPKDYVVKVSFSSFHVSPCAEVNQTAIGISKCDCDFVEIKDGINPDSLVIGTFCGHTLPPEIISSSNLMGIRLSTDGEIVSSGFELLLSAQRSTCDESSLNVNYNIQSIRSPGFETGVIPRGLHCTYVLHASESYATVHLRINHLDLQPGNGNKCDNDRLIIRSITEIHNMSLGSNYVLNKYADNFFTHAYFYDSTLSFPEQFVLCGVNSSLDFYVSGGVSLNLITSPESTSKHKGVDIQVSQVGYCGRNYTEPYGRIQTVYLENIYPINNDCFTLITAPENYTISIYMITIVPDYYFNSRAFFAIFDGDKTTSPLLLKVQSDYVSRSVFSTGRYILMHNHVINGNEQIIYDLNYIITNKGRGCGGKIVNELGRFTSPMYPEVYRKRSSCEWEIETPPNTRLLLRMTEFDLGVACDQNYLSIVDKNGNVVSTFCDETPADYTSPDNYVKVIFTTTVNNGGTGWVADFIGIH